MRVLIAGAQGMVGRAVVLHCSELGDDVRACDSAQLDISKAGRVNDLVDEFLPDTIINCAAWTDVDGCETDIQRAYDVNSRGPANLAVGARRVGASLITISTDYVFDGTKDGFYTQRDDPNPTSVYGQAKLDGEQKVRALQARAVIVRSGWIFGAGGKNFLSTALASIRRGAELKAIGDSFGTPTYAPHLAARLRELAVKDIPGIYHVVNAGGGTSYADFVRALGRAARQSGLLVQDLSMDDLKRPAPRPRNSRLRCLVSNLIGLDPLPHWEEAVAEYISLSG